MKGNYVAILVPVDGGYAVRVPDLPSCVTSGTDLNDAMDMAHDALNACLLSLEDHQVEIPVPTHPDEIAINEGELLAIVPVDTLSYRIQTDTRAVRKSVSLPAWMASLADNKGLSYSKVLQDGLRSLLKLG